MIDIGVIHGRFQVLHNDHLKYLLAGKAYCKHLIIGITNPDPTLTRKDQSDLSRSSEASNPLTYYERYVMVREVMLESKVNIYDFSIVPFPVNFPALYIHYVPVDAVFFLTIYDEWGDRKLKLFTERNLKTHILWRKPIEQKGITASLVRAKIATGQQWENLVPSTTAKLIKKMGIIDRIRSID